MPRKLIAALAVRNQGTRLYAKPLQNLDIVNGISVIDNIVKLLKNLNFIDDIVLGIAEGTDNYVFKKYAIEHKLEFIVGNEHDVLSRLIQCGQHAKATDIFRITSESPFIWFEESEKIWNEHKEKMVDVTFVDQIIDGCGYEIISMKALEKSHRDGDSRHRSEMCSLYIRENIKEFTFYKPKVPDFLFRQDLRLTVDYPEDLIVCRAVYQKFKYLAPFIPIEKIIKFLDENPKLIDLISPYAEQGYSTMYL